MPKELKKKDLEEANGGYGGNYVAWLQGFDYNDHATGGEHKVGESSYASGAVGIAKAKAKSWFDADPNYKYCKYEIWRGCQRTNYYGVITRSDV